MIRRGVRGATRATLVAVGLGLGLAARARRTGPAPADLQGQVALITGGSRGLGFLLAREFAHQGCRIAICARDAPELERARADLARAGAEVLALPCDVADRAQVEWLVAETTRHFGRVDILVNNAGIIQVGPLATMTHRDYEKALAVDFWGVVYPTLAVLPQMRARRGGRIVTITSIGGKISVPHLLPYSAAKFAATGFSEGLRAELARDGITVTTIVPGLMRTGSPVNARFKGQAAREFAWFAVSDSLPVLSMDAERAAREIVAAARRGEAERILTAPASVAVRVNGLVPGLTANLLGLVNRCLPTADGSTTPGVRGEAARQRLRSPLLDALIGPTLAAARRFHQYPGSWAGPAEQGPVGDPTAADMSAPPAQPAASGSDQHPAGVAGTTRYHSNAQ